MQVGLANAGLVFAVLPRGECQPSPEHEDSTSQGCRLPPQEGQQCPNLFKVWLSTFHQLCVGIPL